jgi:hypothetical protein
MNAGGKYVSASLAEKLVIEFDILFLGCGLNFNSPAHEVLSL